MNFLSPYVLMVAMTIIACPALAETVLVYPAPEVDDDTRQEQMELLTTALDRTVFSAGSYSLRPSRGMTEARYLIELAAGNSINVAWSATSEQKEREFIPVRIPISKGLLGYRIALIHKSDQSKIDTILTVADLKRFTVGQGLGWGELMMYEANGIKVSSTEYKNLFKMAQAHRFDLFPLGVNEIFREYDLRGKDTPDLVIEKNLLLYYPWPYYFFFNKKDAVLAKRVEDGLRIMLKDGSFDAIFMKYNKENIRRANFGGRRVIKLHNPSLPQETPLKDTRLWYRPLSN